MFARRWPPQPSTLSDEATTNYKWAESAQLRFAPTVRPLPGNPGNCEGKGITLIYPGKFYLYSYDLPLSRTLPDPFLGKGSLIVVFALRIDTNFWLELWVIFFNSHSSLWNGILSHWLPIIVWFTWLLINYSLTGGTMYCCNPTVECRNYSI